MVREIDIKMSGKLKSIHEMKIKQFFRSRNQSGILLHLVYELSGIELKPRESQLKQFPDSAVLSISSQQTAIEDAIREAYWTLLAQVAIGREEDQIITLSPCDLIEFLYKAAFEVNARGSRLAKCRIECTKTVRDPLHQSIVKK